MTYTKEQREAKAKKNQDMAEQIEQESGLSVGESSTAGAVIEKTQSTEPLPNEFNDEYTLQVDMDYDPASDIFRVPSPQPEYEYRFLRDDQKNMSIKTSTLLKNKGGWQPVPKAHLTKCGFDVDKLSADGLYRVAELILAFMPKRLYEIKRADEVNRTKTRMDSIINRGMEGDSSSGIKAGQMDSGKVSFGKKSRKDVVFTTREE